MELRKRTAPATYGEICDLLESLGELRMQLNGVWKRHVALEARVKRLESGLSWTGSIQGLEGEFTITPLPEWEGA